MINRIIVISLCLICWGVGAQDISQLTHQHHHCGRTVQEANADYLPTVESTDQGRSSITCTYDHISDFAALSTQELYDYLVAADNPRSCINGPLYSYNSTYSPMVFSKQNVDFVAQHLLTLIDEYDGTHNNGVFGTFMYLSIAGLQETFYGDFFDDESWDLIQDACRALAVDETFKNESDTSLYAAAHMFFAASFEDLAADADIIRYATEQLDNLAADTYKKKDYHYPYYYSYYYLMDVFLRYPADKQVYIDVLDQEDAMMASLGDVATNVGLHEGAFQFSDELSKHSVAGLVRHAPYEVLHDVIGPALTAVTETYKENSQLWVTAAVGLVDNDMPFTHTRDEIVENLMTELMPHSYSFDDGKLQVQTPLEYEQVLGLVHSATEVRAQFFRLLGTDQPILGDTNDTLFIKLHGTRESYQQYNDILFGINYPNSGGVYIESYGTFYTFDREEHESDYTLEELFRHEYTHYLQGRYLIAGNWGEAPYYDDSRLVWYEEGMAQFLAGSQRHGPIRGIDPVRQLLQNIDTNSTIEEVFNSSYGNGRNRDYYVYGAMLWKMWYDQDIAKALELFQLIREGRLEEFDMEIMDMKSNPTYNSIFQAYLAEQKDLDDQWISPITTVLLPQEVDMLDLNGIQQEVTDLLPEIHLDLIQLHNALQPKTFVATGSLSYIGDADHAYEHFNDALDQYLTTIESSDYNGLRYTTAHFDEPQTDGEQSVTTFYLHGPINDNCASVYADNIVITAQDQSITLETLTNSHGPHRYRYKEQSATEWTVLDATEEAMDTLYLPYVTSGYEIQYQELCATDLWTSHTESKPIQLCPDVILSHQPISGPGLLTANNELTITSEITETGDVEIASHKVYLQGAFTIQKGGTLTVTNARCKD